MTTFKALYVLFRVLDHKTVLSISFTYVSSCFDLHWDILLFELGLEVSPVPHQPSAMRGRSGVKKFTLGSKDNLPSTKVRMCSYQVYWTENILHCAGNQGVIFGR